MEEYRPEEIETKWQKYWDEHKTFRVGAPGDKKFYCLDMFPYPSGSGLHIGHPLGYTATDIYSRFMRMKGYSVLHPMGFDAFGLPAEQHAVATGEHPALITHKNCDLFTTQMKRLGLSYDWDRSLATCDEEYYHWTQWIFLRLYNSWFDTTIKRSRPIDELPIPESVREAGELAVQEYQAGYRLAYFAEAMVNYCPELGTVLANEEVIDGRSERGGFPVIRKPMKQWMLRITMYAERLLEELEEVDWPENIKEQQRNWIGKKLGAEIEFPLYLKDRRVTAFTTRPDTLFGVTFMVLSPEHPLVEVLTTIDKREKVNAYREEASKMSELNRTMDNRQKTGVFTGGYVVNPINKEIVPVYIGDYVLMSYGTGAVMGVPAHDERDFEFARTFQIDIRPVVLPDSEDQELVHSVTDGEEAWTGGGTMIPIASEVAKALELAGLSTGEAAIRITGWLEREGNGRTVVKYKLRDWLFARQRYWGEPIPIIHWEDGRVTALSDDELALQLPKVEKYQPSDGGESPLARAEDWLYVYDEVRQVRGRRETSTMPQWAGSCWYYLRFIDPRNPSAPWDKELEQKWMPVDLYVGGAEHAVLHLLYARLWHKVLFDLGYVSTVEPFKKLFNQGMIIADAFKNPDGVLVPSDEVEERTAGQYFHSPTGVKVDKILGKMSKSLKNVIDPLEVIAEYGADTVRTYLMFMGPLDAMRPWDAKAIVGNFRFLRKAWNLVEEKRAIACSDSEESLEAKKAMHRVIQRTTADITDLKFNTALSGLMEFVNTVSSLTLSLSSLRSFVILLSPFAPHLAEELWERLDGKDSLAYESWPVFDKDLLIETTVTVVIQVSGKKRGTIDVETAIDESSLREQVISLLKGTAYEASSSDAFITVYQKGTTIPRLVNVIKN